jgi:superfamily II DNA or RNA helicase
VTSENEYTPRLYQLNARDQVINILENQEHSVFLILLPTGMGKTLISTLIIDMMMERGIIKDDEKALFLVQDRKLKYQLYDMASKYGLSDHGYLFLLDEKKTIPAQMSRQHASLAKILFATPILLANAILGKSKRIHRETLDQVKVVIIDEILDILAQSYGKRRPREETIQYIEAKYGRGRTFKEIVHDLKIEIESSQSKENTVNEKQLEDYLLREFAPRDYRLSKKFEPILNLLDLLNPSCKRIIIGMTAALSQDKKIDLLKTTFGGSEHVVDIHPVGDDFEDYRPAYNLQRIRVFDDWISQVDSLISSIKRDLMRPLNSAYKVLTGQSSIPVDRILLFITDLIGKKEIRENLMKKLGNDEQRVANIIASANGYLQMTVARQRLLESTFRSFNRFINNITNKILTNNSDFQSIVHLLQERIDSNQPDEKEKRLLFWLDRFVQQGKKVLVMCRFVDTTKHLLDSAVQNNIPSTHVHGSMSGSIQHIRIKEFKEGTANVLFASERLIEKGTDLPEADVGIYYGTTLSLERYEQSLGRIRSNIRNVKTLYTISYNQTVEDEKSLKRDTMFLELIGGKLKTTLGTNVE